MVWLDGGSSPPISTRKGFTIVNPFLVEMGGLEPPSNQTINMLSTCLFFLWLSGRGCRKTGHLNLILWGLGCFKGVRTGIPLEMIPHMPGP